MNADHHSPNPKCCGQFYCSQKPVASGFKDTIHHKLVLPSRRSKCKRHAFQTDGKAPSDFVNTHMATGAFLAGNFPCRAADSEIGIRKILRAGEAGIVAILSRDYMRQIPVSFLLLPCWLVGHAQMTFIAYWIFQLNCFRI